MKFRKLSQPKRFVKRDNRSDMNSKRLCIKSIRGIPSNSVCFINYALHCKLLIKQMTKRTPK